MPLPIHLKKIRWQTGAGPGGDPGGVKFPDVLPGPIHSPKKQYVAKHKIREFNTPANTFANLPGGRKKGENADVLAGAIDSRKKEKLKIVKNADLMAGAIVSAPAGGGAPLLAVRI